MFAGALWSLVLGTLLVNAISPTRTEKRQNVTPNPKFVSTNTNGQFIVNGSEFRFVGTNAYWLQALNTEQDVIDTFSNLTAHGINVVRTWAFNDVDTIPVNGTWFQLIQNGTTTINNGTNGLQKLDTIIQQAENFGIKLMLTLTNNWNPRPLFDDIQAEIDNLTATVEGLVRRDVTAGTNNSLPRNYLSNDYGGMDVYIRQFGLSSHDDFFTNETIISTFENYTTQVVSRYVDSPAVLAWEIANDPRCNSSISASANCTSTVITSWINRVSQHVQTVDPNHLISSGAAGYFCDNCQKFFEKKTPPPVQSPAPGQRRAPPPDLSRGMLARNRKEIRKRMRAAAKRDTTGGIRIRGKWKSTAAVKRQSTVGVEPAPDLSSGTQGVDSQDIINIPQIGFGTFQLFPDQQNYGSDPLGSSAFNDTVEAGLAWIQTQAQIAKLFGKPIIVTGFGLVTQSNAPFFVPFNTTVAPFGPGNVNNASGTVAPYGITDQQRDDAYSQWLAGGLEAGLQGMLQYQWSQGNLTAIDGTTIEPNQETVPATDNQDQAGITPNDGYSIQGVDQPNVQNVLQTAAQGVETPQATAG